MHAVRRFEDVLMDIATDEPEINRLADAIVDFKLKEVRYFLSLGVDAIQFADDFGTQSALILSPAWRRFFRPRFQRLIEPVLAAGSRRSTTPAEWRGTCSATCRNWASTRSGPR